MSRFLNFLLSVIVIGVCVCEANAEQVQTELIIHNGKVTTQNLAQPSAEAVAIREGRIMKVGSNLEVLALRGKNTRVIDAGGRRLIPGLNDSHLHAVRGGRFYHLELRWDGIPTLAQALDMIRQQAKRTPKGQWVRVIGGWSPYQFKEKRMPTIAELNEAAPDTPVFVLYLYSQGFLNQAGLDTLGITAETKPPAGGRYELGADGKPTGRLLAEPNPTILYKTIGQLPQLSEEEQVNSSKYFYRDLNRFGLTSAIDAGGGGHVFPKNYVASTRLAKQGDIPLRISFYLFPQVPDREHEDFQKWIAMTMPGRDGSQGPVNGYVMEGGGEFLVWSAGDFENFLAARPEQGETMEPQLDKVTRLLVKNRWPFRIHATYNESISRILDVFEQINQDMPFDGLRWAVDHAETISSENITRIKTLGGGIAVQNRMAFAGEFFRDRYGLEHAVAAPPLREMIQQGIPLGAGTDATRVSSYNPWMSLYWLVTGKTVGGTQLFQKENRLTRIEALKRYTLGSAWFSGEEDVKGRIAPGQYADFALLSDDFFMIPAEDIKYIESVLTVMDGTIVYAAEEYASHSPPLPPVKPSWSPVALYSGYWNPPKTR